MKKNVLVSYVVEADTDLKAIFALKNTLFQLPDNELAKFEAFDVVDLVEENN